MPTLNTQLLKLTIQLLDPTIALVQVQYAHIPIISSATPFLSPLPAEPHKHTM